MGRHSLERRVDRDVECAACERDPCGQRIHRHAQDPPAEPEERDTERSGRLSADRAARNRAHPGAGHATIEIAIEHVVERAGAADRQCQAEERPQRRVERGQAAVGEHHAGEARDQHQLDDLRLG